MDVVLLGEIQDLISDVNTNVANVKSVVDTVNTNVNSVKTTVGNISNYTITNNTASKTGVLSQKLSYTISLLENSTYGLNALKSNGEHGSKLLTSGGSGSKGVRHGQAVIPSSAGSAGQAGYALIIW